MAQAYADLQSYPANPYMGAGGGGSSGWWSGPKNLPSGKPKDKGMSWLQKNLSPEFMGGMKNIYSSYEQQPQSLAELYKTQLGGQPELEQMQYNQALARMKGQMGTMQQSLLGGLPPGGMDSGAYAGGMQDILRQFGMGTHELGIQSYMKNLADQEARNKQMIEYSNQDIANKAGWQQGYGGWMQQMFPVEQWGIQYPNQLAAARQEAAWNRSMQEEQVNAARRNEMAGWYDRAMALERQRAGQYYGGQGQYGDYQGRRGAAVGGGYGGQWSPW